ncbi:hypothetical protein PHYSODRAFT_525570 [Phytophthora sojae]|uniref:Uncharacterized protein n=1 Tax=Phytophthora sojae (strain P6497) TaxID=1094619 RepID=G5A5G1_PHYSP|nr:hypothetical protein PHYSODRAFT_525570 [Phytophthora sojae]EGZ09345.1 hypothetical protein PHYSODRAFT_525570 [Phytophthora sojae]|eukprot:XP_009535978.1 hypothetical protein PHYSODRAFT_525570 [Phytophthora sojae]
MFKLNALAPASPTVVHVAPKKSTQLQIFRHPTTRTNGRWLTAPRMLLAVWLFQGVLPLILQTRSYLKFIQPHTIPEKLVAPPDIPKETANITEHCPVKAFILAGVWWNHDPTHYYRVGNSTICHVVVPQYNTHGNYVIGGSRTTPYRTAPSSCADVSFPFEIYLYHASIGFYSFYEGEIGTYCTTDQIAYMAVDVLGTYDINGKFLAEDTGSTKPRVSFWYGVAGAMWLVYRSLTIHRSFVSCIRYGRRREEMGETLRQHEAMVFVQESLRLIRLTAHGATNYQRTALLYLIVEGIMTDLFLIIANDGWMSRVQYASMGYNLSGLMLLLFEMLENTNLLKEKWRLRIKRTFFSYETALIGEFVSALVFQMFLSGLNGSDLKRSKPTALAVSYYFWSLICHAIVVVCVVSIICSVRVPWALLYVWSKHQSLAVLSEPCCVDTALGVRSRVMLLGGYRWDEGKLYYETAALKAFGMLKMEENGVEYLVMHKLYWFTVPRDNLIGIGVITGPRVEPCNERPCTGIVSFLDRRLGGASIQTDCHQRSPSKRTVQVLAMSEKLDEIPEAPNELA